MHLRATIIPCLAVLHLAVLAFPQVCGDAVCATNVASTTQARPTLSDDFDFVYRRGVAGAERHYEKREESSSWVGRAWDTVMKFGQSIKQGIQKGILKLMQNQILKHPIALPPGVTPANLTFISKDGGVIWTGDHTDKKNMPPGAEWERITTKDWLSPRKRYAQATLPRDVEVTPEQVEESEDDADMLEYLDFDPYPGYDDY